MACARFNLAYSAEGGESVWAAAALLHNEAEQACLLMNSRRSDSTCNHTTVGVYMQSKSSMRVNDWLMYKPPGCQRHRRRRQRQKVKGKETERLTRVID